MARAPTTAPTATNDIWPSDTWPAQPVRTTIDSATITKTATLAALISWLGLSTAGSHSSNPTPATIPAARTARTSGRRHSTSGTPRTSAVACHEAVASKSTRASPPRRTSRATMITTPNTG